MHKADLYHGDHATGPETVTHAHVLVVGIFAPPDKVLVPHEVGAVVDHEAATLHPAGVAAAQVGGQISAVAAGLIGATLEVPVLVEDDLEGKRDQAQYSEIPLSVMLFGNTGTYLP